MATKSKFLWKVKMYCPNCMEMVGVVSKGDECPNCGHDKLLTIQQRMAMPIQSQKKISNNT